MGIRGATWPSSTAELVFHGVICLPHISHTLYVFPAEKLHVELQGLGWEGEIQVLAGWHI